MNVKIKIEIGEEELKNIVIDHLLGVLGDISFIHENLRIEVKSKQNFKSEWESASFRAIYEGGD